MEATIGGSQGGGEGRGGSVWTESQTLLMALSQPGFNTKSGANTVCVCDHVSMQETCLHISVMPACKQVCLYVYASSVTTVCQSLAIILYNPRLSFTLYARRIESHPFGSIYVTSTSLPVCVFVCTCMKLNSLQLTLLATEGREVMASRESSPRAMMPTERYSSILHTSSLTHESSTFPFTWKTQDEDQNKQSGFV